MTTITNPASPATTFDLRPLMFENFVCSMAVMSFVALAGPIARVIGLAPWQIGLTITAAGVAWMVMARIWGVASDRHGRRPVMLFGLAGFAISYVALVLFIDFSLRATTAPLLAFTLIVLARGIAGIFYAAVPATTAALVADNVPPDRRAPAMAAIGASSAAGMVVGPGLAGLVAPYSLSLPLYAIGALPVIALALLWHILPRQAPTRPSGTTPPRLTDARLRRPMAVAFAAAFSVSVAQSIVGFFALDRLHLDTGDAARAAGIALAIVGAALVCAQILLRRLGWPPRRFIRIGATVSAVGFGSVMLATSPAMLWGGYAVAAFGMGWVYPSVSALAANSVEAHEQGAAAGSVATAQGLGIIVGPIAGTALYGMENGAPYALVAAILLIAALWPERGSRPQPVTG